MSKSQPGPSPRVFISTGELSGEMHASHLLRHMQELRAGQGLPPYIAEGNGSAQMADAGVKLLNDVAGWSEMGIIRNLMRAGFFTRIIRQTVSHILGGSFDLVVLVDNRFFNLNLARLLREQGYKGKIAYYVAPVRWESLYDPQELERSLENPRFRMIRDHCDLAIPIYPVSLDTYERLGIPYVYPGHPLCELAIPQLSDEEFDQLLGIYRREDEPEPVLVGVMPGSRRGEVSDIAPALFGAVRMLQGRAQASSGRQVVPVCPLAHKALELPVRKAADAAGVEGLRIINQAYRYDLMARAELMLAKSGTGLHECMIMGAPALMCYRFHPVLAWIGRHLMRFSMPHYGFPNLIANREVVPELVQEDCNAQRITTEASRLLFDDEARSRMLAGYEMLRKKVCLPDPLDTAAAAVNGLLDGQDQ